MLKVVILAIEGSHFLALKKAPMKLTRAGYPMERIATDILGPLPESENGNRYILEINDYFTKWVEAFPIPDQIAETVSKC